MRTERATGLHAQERLRRNKEEGRQSHRQGDARGAWLRDHVRTCRGISQVGCSVRVLLGDLSQGGRTSGNGSWKNRLFLGFKPKTELTANLQRECPVQPWVHTGAPPDWIVELWVRVSKVTDYPQKKSHQMLILHKKTPKKNLR